MRYLRMFTNAVAGGLLGAVYLAVIVLQINPQVPLVSMTAVRWFAVLVAFYGLHLSVAVYLIILVREGLASRPLQPGWLSVRLLAWLGAAFAAVTAIITWGNLQGLRAVLGDAAAARMQTAAVAATISAAVLVGVAALRYSFGRKGSRAAAGLLALALASSVGVPLWVRGPGDLPVPIVARLRPSDAPAITTLGAVGPRVRMILLDGASLSLIRERVAVGRLPNLGRLLDRGALMDVATLKPTQAEPVWAAAATGKYPPTNGVRSNAVYRVRSGEPDPVDLLPDYCFAYALIYQGFVTAGPATADSLRARPVWTIAADHGLASGIVRWPLTYPARLERGYLISDQFHLGSSSPLRLGDALAGVPTSAVEIARQAFDESLFSPGPEVEPAAPAEATPDGLSLARWDRLYSQAAALIEPHFATRLTAVRYQGLDALSHVYWEHAEPGRFSRADPAKGALLDRYYDYIDGEVGRLLARLSPGDLLLVVSGFGMERVDLTKRLLARVLRQPNLTGSHESAPDGFLIAYGTNVAHAQVPRGAIVDVAPTLLYYLGLPVGRDMDGFARSDLFLHTYRRDHPVTYISTHER